MTIKTQSESRDPRLLPPGCTFDLATTADAAELATLFGAFFCESDYGPRGVVYSTRKAADWLERVIAAGSFPHIVARLDGQIVGVISWSLDDSFSERPIAVLHTIYVMPQHRRSIIGRMLVALALDIARHEGACAFSAPIASGMREARSLINLFGKAGFEGSGAILTRAL